MKTFFRAYYVALIKAMQDAKEERFYQRTIKQHNPL